MAFLGGSRERGDDKGMAASGHAQLELHPGWDLPLSSDVVSSIRATGDCCGGGTGREFVENLLNPGEESWNKWFFHLDARATVTLALAMPVVISDVGLKSANDCPHRDPVDFDLLGLMRTKEVWRIQVRRHTFTRRWQTFCFQTKSNAPCDEVQLCVHRTGSPHEVQLGQVKLFGRPADVPEGIRPDVLNVIKRAEQRAQEAETRVRVLESLLHGAGLAVASSAGAAAAGGGAASDTIDTISH